MKNKSKVRFKCLEIYHFSRCVGIDKVPERGNNPLGMESNHFNSEKIDITRKKLRISHFGDGDKFINFQKLCTSTPVSPKTNSFRDHSEDDNESIHSVMSIDYTPRSLQPLNPIQRKKCLESAGVDINIDTNDDVSRNPKILTKLREDRKQVGCKCSNLGKCDPSKCSCSSQSIPCQSDGNKFPCKCGDKCSNQSGKRVYLYEKIRFHYQHTFKRNLLSDNDIDIDILSTLNGDCTTCSSISEETWKTNREAYHQTRSRKRAGDSNLENNNVASLKSSATAKEVLLISNSISETITTNGHANGPLSIVTDNQQPLMCDRDQDRPPDTVLVNCPIVLKYGSPQFVGISPQSTDSVNKENIGFSPQIKVQWKLSNEKIVETTNISPVRTPIYKSLQISNQSFLFSPISSPIVSGCSDACAPCTYSTELDYHTSFLNKNSFEEYLSSPSIVNLSPVKFNPISLASVIGNSLIDRLTDENKWLLHHGNNSVDIDSPNIDDQWQRPITNKTSQSEWSAFCDDNLIEYDGNTAPPNDAESGGDTRGIVEIAKEANQLQQIQSDSDCCPLSPCPNMHIRKCYSFRLVENVPQYKESPIVDCRKRKSWRVRSVKKSAKFPDSRNAKCCQISTPSPPSQTNNPESGGLGSFLIGEEIRFFDIPCGVEDQHVDGHRNERADDC